MSGLAGVFFAAAAFFFLPAESPVAAAFRFLGIAGPGHPLLPLLLGLSLDGSGDFEPAFAARQAQQMASVQLNRRSGECAWIGPRRVVCGAAPPPPPPNLPVKRQPRRRIPELGATTSLLPLTRSNVDTELLPRFIDAI